AGLSDAGGGAPTSGRGLSAMLPEQIVGSTLGGMPIFVGALALIFGALVAGSEYGWATWKTVLAQGARRGTVYAAKLTVVALGAALLILVLLGVGAAASALVAAAEDQPLAWPSLIELAKGLGSGWLIATMWGALGMLLGIA